jgi:hypothetical protein
MLRDDSSDGGRRPVPARNVLGERLDICSFKPMTGSYNDRVTDSPDPFARDCIRSDAPATRAN